jgi:uncharacterized protein (DUF2235 family)
MALATSFDQHVIHGYRFIMRRYKPGSKIYLFGSSRGAYTARLLNEMLDYVGLLDADNEELVPFVWVAFSALKFRPLEDKEEGHKAFNFLKLCRETICRPVERAHCLGLFDTVNGVAKFRDQSEVIPSTKIIRHAVSIDERRIKFQPVSISTRPETGHSSIKPTKPTQRLNPEISTHHGEGDDVRSIIPSQEVSGTEKEETQDIEEVYFAGNHGWAVAGNSGQAKCGWQAKYRSFGW